MLVTHAAEKPEVHASGVQTPGGTTYVVSYGVVAHAKSLYCELARYVWAKTTGTTRSAKTKA